MKLFSKCFCLLTDRRQRNFREEKREVFQRRQENESTLMHLTRKEVHRKKREKTVEMCVCVAVCDVSLPAVMFSSGQPESSLTAVALSGQMIRVPPGHL